MKNLWRAKNLEWMTGANGVILVRKKSSQKFYILSDEIVSVWIMFEDGISLKKLTERTGLKKEKLEYILKHLLKYKLIVKS